MVTLREIDEQVKKLEKEAQKILLEAIHGHYSNEDEQAQKIAEAKERTAEITNKILKLTEKRLELIKGGTGIFRICR